MSGLEVVLLVSYPDPSTSQRMDYITTIGSGNVTAKIGDKSSGIPERFN